MRKKERKLVITSLTTAHAMAMEKACRANSLAGRLIPVPREISAGCGLAWCAPPDRMEDLLMLLSEQGLEQEDLHECMI